MLVEGGAEFERALASIFHFDGEGKLGGGIEEQDHAVEFAFAGAAGERETERVENHAAAKWDGGFYVVDDSFETNGIRDGAFVENAVGEYADHFAGTGADEDGAIFGEGEVGCGVVVKDEGEKRFEMVERWGFGTEGGW